MTVLNLAAGLYLGSVTVERAYLGATQVWPGDAPAPAFAAWGDSHGAVLADGGRTLTWDGTPFANAYAVSDVPLAGKQRWQVRYLIDYTADPAPSDYYTAAGVWSRLTGQFWGGGEIFHSNTWSPAQPGAGVSPAPFYCTTVTNGEWGAGFGLPAEPGTLLTFEFLSDVTESEGTWTARVWARQVTAPGEVSAWIGGGDPEAGTTPSMELTASNPFHVGASTAASDGSAVTLLHPSDFLATPAVGGGFATGIGA